MILYFSGTGNSEYVAKKISREIQDESINLLSKIRNHDFSTLHSDKPWIVVAPTYAWRIPRILSDWISSTTLRGSSDIYFIMTCGANIGNASFYVRKLSLSKGLNYLGCYPILMPENYIALFTTPNKDEARLIIEQAETLITAVSRTIAKNEKIEENTIALKDRFNSGLVNDIFYPVFVHAKKFRVENKCISCGQCAKLCPLNNIQILEDKPEWGNNCTHCMACICNCPTEAIEYGEHSKGLPRTVCPKVL